MSHFAGTKGAFQLPDLVSGSIADALFEELAPRAHNSFPSPDQRDSRNVPKLPEPQKPHSDKRNSQALRN
jgi:hypothetical protein